MNYYCQFLDFNLVDVTSFLINAILVYLAIIGISNYKKVSKWNSSYKYLTQVTESLSIMLLLMMEGKVKTRVHGERVDWRNAEIKEAVEEVNAFNKLLKSRISDAMERFFTSYQVLQYSGFDKEKLRTEFLNVRNTYLQMRKSMESMEPNLGEFGKPSMETINNLAQDCTDFKNSIILMLKKLNKL